MPSQRELLDKVLGHVERRKASIAVKSRVYLALHSASETLVSLVTSGHNLIYGSQFFAQSVISTSVGMALSALATALLQLQRKLKFPQKMRKYRDMANRLDELQMTCYRLALDGQLDPDELAQVQRDLKAIDDLEDSSDDGN